MNRAQAIPSPAGPRSFFFVPTLCHSQQLLHPCAHSPVHAHSRARTQPHARAYTHAHAQ